MNERAKNKILLVLFLLLALIIYMVVTLTTPAAENERRLSSTIIVQPAGEVVSLNKLTDFEWDKAYTFAPYTSKKEICSVIGINANDCKIALETVAESMVQMIFTKDGEIVCVLLGYPDKLGYRFDFGEAAYDYLVFTSSEDPQFRVERPYTNYLLLRYMSADNS